MWDSPTVELLDASGDTRAVNWHTIGLEKAEEGTTQAVRELLGDGFTVRDIGAMLGLSPQRISQITHQAA